MSATTATTTSTRVARRAATARGVMLVEVLLALAISAMIATVVASLLFATATGSRDRQDMRRRNVRVDVLTARVDGAIRSASMVLGRDANCLVLWVADTRANALPDLSELRRIEWNATAKELRCYEAPPGLLPAEDVTYPMATDFVGLTAGLKGTSNFPVELWATGVTAWDTTPTAPTTTTRLIGYGVTIQTAAGPHAARSSVTLRGTSGTGG